MIRGEEIYSMKGISAHRVTSCYVPCALIRGTFMQIGQRGKFNTNPCALLLLLLHSLWHFEKRPESLN